MALYLVEHTPSDEAGPSTPSRLHELATVSLSGTTGPKWLRAWSPDLNDDRIFSLWQADSAAQIEALLERFGFLHDRVAKPMRVHEWGPEDVLAVGTED